MSLLRARPYAPCRAWLTRSPPSPPSPVRRRPRSRRAMPASSRTLRSTPRPATSMPRSRWSSTRCLPPARSSSARSTPPGASHNANAGLHGRCAGDLLLVCGPCGSEVYWRRGFRFKHMSEVGTAAKNEKIAAHEAKVRHAPCHPSKMRPTTTLPHEPNHHPVLLRKGPFRSNIIPAPNVPGHVR